MKSGEFGPFFPRKIFCISQNHIFSGRNLAKIRQEKRNAGSPGEPCSQTITKKGGKQMEKNAFCYLGIRPCRPFVGGQKGDRPPCIILSFLLPRSSAAAFASAEGKKTRQRASAPASQRSTDSSALQIIFSAPDLLLILLLLPRSSEVLFFFFFLLGWISLIC